MWTSNSLSCSLGSWEVNLFMYFNFVKFMPHMPSAVQYVDLCINSWVFAGHVEHTWHYRTIFHIAYIQYKEPLIHLCILI